MHFSLALKRRVILASWVVLVIALYAFKNTSFLVRVLSTISAIALVYGVDHYFDVKFKPTHYFFVYIMVISGFLFSPLYYIYPNYDKVQHLLLPILFSSIIFHLVSRLRLHRKWELFFTFAIVIGALALFELGEYGIDYFFNLQLQGVFVRSISGLEKYSIIMDRIDDTMIDLLLGAIGALIYWIAGIVKLFKIRKRKN